MNNPWMWVLLIIIVGMFFYYQGGALFNSQASDSDTQATTTDEMIEEDSAAFEEKPAATPAATAPRTSTPQRPAAASVPANTVWYTDTGFVPNLFEVRAGTSITFVNKSSKTMRVTSDKQYTGADQYYPEFGQTSTVAPGGTFVFLFTKTGSWVYANLNYQQHKATVVVLPQKLQQ